LQPFIRLLYMVNDQIPQTSSAQEISAAGGSAVPARLPDRARRHDGAGASASTLSPVLVAYLTELQNQFYHLEAQGDPDAGPYGATVLRHIKDHAPQHVLTAGDENAIELLATIFDYVFADAGIAPDLKRLMGRLQIPLVKVALSDKDCLFEEDHPAPRLLDTLARSSATREQTGERADPFYEMVEQIVLRVQQEIEPHLGLWADILADLENFLAAEEALIEHALADAIAETTRQEKMLQARILAENDVAARIETGEVAGFVEAFLEMQWVRILTLAHNIAETKPDALVRVLKVMDDLIWSIQPKTSPEERRNLVARLPSILSLMNAWLNVLKWDEPERVQFFSKLAERHAAIARASIELSPRLQVQLAVNVAQKASERQLNRRAKKFEEKLVDQFTQAVEAIPCGVWVEFLRNAGVRTRLKLAWISPNRSRFIFMNGQGHSPLSLTAEELAHAFRNRTAATVPTASVVERALTAALKGFGAK
jgi:hypothetical protein